MVHELKEEGSKRSKQEEKMVEMLKMLKSLEEVVKAPHKLLFQTCEKAKSQALTVPSPGVDLGRKVALFSPLHSGLSSCHLCCPPPPPPPPDNPSDQWMQESPLPGLGSLLLPPLHTAVSFCTDIPPSGKSRRLPGTHQEMGDLYILYSQNVWILSQKQ